MTKTKKNTSKKRFLPPGIDARVWTTIPEAAKKLGVHEVTFRRWVSTEAVRVLRVPSRRRVYVSLKWLGEVAKERASGTEVVEPQFDFSGQAL